MGQWQYRPAHRERLYDTDEQRRPGPAVEPDAGRGEAVPPGREAPVQDRSPGDFRHGGLDLQGHVPQPPRLETAQPLQAEGAPGGAGNEQTGDFGGGFHAQGHVPQPVYAGSQAGAQADEDFDPDYLQWREAQLRQLDDDYRAWRRHKFAEDFSRWRERSSGGAG